MITTRCSNKWIPALSRVLVATAFALLVGTSHAFSLLGPFETWQTQSLGYNYSGEDIGGPKQLGEEYRWNIPEVTVGVDRAFYDFFGPEGVRAVKEAFQILNEVPAASEVNLDSFPLDSRRMNFRASATNLLNLKTAILSLSLAQVGLADPERYVWTLRERMTSFNPPITNYLVVQRNFDPESFLPSSYVNEVRYSYSITEYEQPFFYADAVESPIGVTAERPLPYSSVTGLSSPQLEPGLFVTELTRDDVGGLNYLLRKENINYEPLPAGVWLDHPFEPTTAPIVEALRPGIEKVNFTFIDEPWDTQQNWSKTVSWTDHYYNNGVLTSQRVKRVISRPDIVFSAADLGTRPGSVFPRLYSATSPQWRSVAIRQNTGPGIIEGGTTITLAKLTKSIINQFPGGTGEESYSTPRWGLFDSSALPPIIFPYKVEPDPLIVIARSTGTPSNLLISISQPGTATYQLQSSVDLTQWTPTGMTLSSNNSYQASVEVGAGVRFFRAVRANVP